MKSLAIQVMDWFKGFRESYMHIIKDLMSYLEYRWRMGFDYIPPSDFKLLKVLLSQEEGLLGVKKRVEGCRHCRLHRTRTNIVFGDGNSRARLVFVGEAPGREEDLQRKPFVGRAGRLLTDMIKAMGLEREDVYITNVVKCRPPQNRTPQWDEIRACLPFLEDELDVIGPGIICALGRVAAQALLNTRESLTQLRGKLHSYNGIPLIPTYHPSYLLQYPAMKREAWKDLKKVKEYYEGLRKEEKGSP